MFIIGPPCTLNILREAQVKFSWCELRRRSVRVRVCSCVCMYMHSCVLGPVLNSGHFSSSGRYTSGTGLFF